MKIAILMLLHEYGEYQKRVISHLSEDFEIFVHIDRNSDIPVGDVLINNRVHAYKEYKTYWGSFNLVLATLLLYKESYSYCEKPFDRYVLISGSDIPIKSNREIISFFSGNNKNYISCKPLPRDDWRNSNRGLDRIDYYHFAKLREYGKSGGKAVRLVSRFYNRALDFLFLSLPKKLNLKRKRLGVKYYGGSQWVNLSADCVSRVLDYLNRNRGILRYFKHTLCPDEFFFHTIILNYIQGIELENNDLRYIDWDSGPEYPRTLRTEDYDRIMSSDALFARKVSSSVDPVLIDKIMERVSR